MWGQTVRAALGVNVNGQVQPNHVKGGRLSLPVVGRKFPGHACNNAGLLCGLVAFSHLNDQARDSHVAPIWICHAINLFVLPDSASDGYVACVISESAVRPRSSQPPSQCEKGPVHHSYSTRRLTRIQRTSAPRVNSREQAERWTNTARWVGLGRPIDFLSPPEPLFPASSNNQRVH